MHGNDDPFASITVLCHVSSSQEDRLRHCPFAQESEDDDPTPAAGVYVASTGILMLSPPESSEPNDDSTPHDVFQTPPEGSVIPSSEEQGSMTVDHPIDPAVHGPRDAEAHDDTLAVGGLCTDGTGTVDLGKDSDLGFSVTQKIDDDWEAHSSRGEVSQSEWKKLELLARELLFREGLTESPSKKSKISEQNLVLEAPETCVGALADQNTESFESGVKLECERHQNIEISKETAIEINGDDGKACAKRMLESTSGDSEILQSESEESREGDTQIVPSESEESSEDDWEEAEDGEGNGRSCSREQVIRPIERLQYVSPGKQPEIANAGESYRLPPAENGAERVENDGDGKKATTLDVLKILKEGCDDKDDSLKNVSIFEICKRRGVIFPQPRWWPEEGFKVVDNEDDEGDDGEREKGEK